jgi:hypothetical protein
LEQGLQADEQEVHIRADQEHSREQECPSTTNAGGVERAYNHCEQNSKESVHKQPERQYERWHHPLERDSEATAQSSHYVSKATDGEHELSQVNEGVAPVKRITGEYKALGVEGDLDERKAASCKKQETNELGTHFDWKAATTTSTSNPAVKAYGRKLH